MSSFKVRTVKFEKEIIDRRKRGFSQLEAKLEIILDVNKESFLQ